MSLQRLMTVSGAMLLLAFWAPPVLGQEQAATKPPPVQHDLEGRAQCLMCHTAGAMEAVPDAPANHEGRANESCLWCHAQDAPIQTTEPKAISHDTEGRAACLMCHTAGVMEPVPDVPASHKKMTDQYCQLCHKPAAS